MKKEYITPEIALERLLQGNRTYIEASRNSGDISPERRRELADNGQNPYAIVITCSDSRTPPEHIFNAGLGELFVIRNAGNLVGAYETGSTEYAAEHLNISLAVVLGHNNCGAVNSAVESYDAQGALGAVLSEINKSVTKAKETDLSGKEFISLIEDLNIVNSVNRLMESPVISRLVKSGKLSVIGAKYNLQSGKVVLLK